MSAAAIVILGAVLGGVVNWALAERDRRAQGRAAARVVGEELTSALLRHHAPQQRPFSPVFIDYGAYAVVWESERKALARTMTTDDYATVSKAFEELRTIGKMEAAGRDLSEEVFDGLWHAGQACEFARRVTWRYAHSPRERLAAWVRQKRQSRIEGRELRRVSRQWREARESESSIG